ncbi:hypothetical protein [Xanthocytophaga agilis]|uniref:Uncharacterized protein n=1 Tax=Xanthocytophaga agilis TaxID=3048010 RepID=A0AAE3R7L2_9BACT|nr:hypothetical protein [Xanthocytophaga agilis]MDJ1504665.1 hypothetical protein [Xanthocytophaga agilis]
MKKIIVSISLLIGIGIVGVAPALGQSSGYWVTESDIHTKQYTIVHFYNDANVQIYEEKLDGVFLNLKRKKTVQQLNAALNKVMQNWISNRELSKEDHWVAAMMK